MFIWYRHCSWSGLKILLFHGSQRIERLNYIDAIIKASIASYTVPATFEERAEIASAATGRDGGTTTVACYVAG